MAAVFAAGIVTAGVLREAGQSVSTEGQDPAASGDTHWFDYVSEPLSLNLDEAIAVSEQHRVKSVGPVLTLDLDTIPQGWTVEPFFTVTTTQSPTGTYWQQIGVTTPDRTELVINIMGPLASTPTDPDPELDIDGEPIEIRGQPGRINRGELQWIEQDSVVIHILGGSNPGLAELSEDLLVLVESLEPITMQLAWDGGIQMASPNGPSHPDATPLFSGTLAGTSWQIDEDLQLLVGDEARQNGQAQFASPEEAAMVSYSVDPVGVPGGVILFGRAPDTVTHLRLHLRNATVDLPLAPIDRQEVAFAVPISDLLDPVEITLLGQDETVLATIPLRDFPPYQGGAIGAVVPIASE